jgi:hypothetical protein
MAFKTPLGSSILYKDSENTSHLNTLLSTPWNHTEEQNIASRIFNTAVDISLVSLMLWPIYSRIEPVIPVHMMLFVPMASKEVCGKAVKLALFFLLFSLGVFVYD